MYTFCYNNYYRIRIHYLYWDNAYIRFTAVRHFSTRWHLMVQVQDNRHKALYINYICLGYIANF